MTRTTIQLVQQELARQALALAAPVTEALGAYVSLLARWSARIRITGSAEPTVLVRRHLADAIAAARLLGLDRTGAMIDAGSGGGLPGVPLALLLPGLSPFTLVDSTQRKCAFLRTALSELALGQRGEVVCARLEDLADQRTLDGAFDVACSRATWAPAEWLARAARLVRRAGGQVLVFVARAAALPGGLTAAPVRVAPIGAGSDRVVCSRAPSRPLRLRARGHVAYELHDGTPRLVVAYEIDGVERLRQIRSPGGDER